VVILSAVIDDTPLHGWEESGISTIGLNRDHIVVDGDHGIGVICFLFVIFVKSFKEQRDIFRLWVIIFASWVESSDIVTNSKGVYIKLESAY